MSTMKKNMFVQTQLALAICLLTSTSAFALTYSSPLLVDDTYVKLHGNVVAGNFAGSLDKPAITVTATSPITIMNSNLTGPADLIYATSADISVINTTGISTNPNQLNTQKGMFLHVENAYNVLVQSCQMQDSRFGVYINRYIGNYSLHNTIRIINNRVSNTDGRPSDGKGGYLAAGEWNSHAFQLNKVQNVPYIDIAWNEVINLPLQSQSSDIINMYDSSGIPSSHLMIHDNYLQGAYAANPGTDSYTGGGIITDGLATATAATTAAYIDIYNNQIVSTSNYGVAIAAGHDNSIYNNRVVSSGLLANGTSMGMTSATGAYVANYYKLPSTTFFNNIIYNNTIGLITKNSSGTLFRNDWWFPDQTATYTNMNWLPNNAQHPSLEDEATEYQLWLQKYLAHRQNVKALSANFER
jgi:hypothetical protein